MRCKFCRAELTEGNSLCPKCGKDNAKNSLDMLQKRLKCMRLALMILLIVVVLAILTGVVAYFVQSGMEEKPFASQTTVPADGNSNDETCKGSYTYSENELLAHREDVMAVMGDAKLTVGQFRVFYWNAIYDFLSQYGSYISYYGLDITKPLDQQNCTFLEEPITWQQNFIKQALTTWVTYQSLANEATEADYEMDKQYVDALDKLKENLEASAKENDFESVDAMLLADYGPGCTYEDYYHHTQLYYYAVSYYEHLLNTQEVSDGEIQEYYEANKELLSTQYGFQSISGPLVSVRHILIMPEGDGNSYTDAQWEACRVEAQKIYDEWLAGDMTEQAFIAAAKEHSEDGNASEGGIYPDVYKGQMVKEFNDWCFDGSRAYGDHGLVKTTYGYHIMFFVKGYEGYYPPIVSGIRYEKLDEYLTKLEGGTDYHIDYEAIMLNQGNLDKK